VFPKKIKLEQWWIWRRRRRRRRRLVVLGTKRLKQRPTCITHL
jgi:hypothetical protein